MRALADNVGSLILGVALALGLLLAIGADQDVRAVMELLS